MEMTNAELVAAIAQHVDLPPEQVTSVLAAAEAVRQGDPVGMIRRDADTGQVAVRVLSYGVAQWRVSGLDGEQYNDLQPTLPWPAVFTPVADEEPAGS